MDRHTTELDLAVIEAQLATPEAQAALDRVQGFHSMARLTGTNYDACLDHLSRLADPRFAAQLVAAPGSSTAAEYVEELQHRTASYVVSSVSLLEHIEHHVRSHFPDPEQF